MAMSNSLNENKENVMTEDYFQQTPIGKRLPPNTTYVFAHII